MAVRERLDRSTALGRSYTTMRPFIYEGRSFDNGEAFPIEGMSFHTVQTLHGSRYIDLVPTDQEPPDDQQGVTLTQKPGGNYEITAPWLADPVKAKGRANAEAEATRIREEGPPLGFIDGGSQVTLEDQSGGWYLISAPWLEQSEKVQGRLGAEQRQREIHDAGEPDSYKGVTLTAGENGWWTITRPEFDGELKVQGEQAAREAAASLRAGQQIEGQPAEWNPTPPLKEGDVVLVGPDGGDLAGLKATIEKIDGDNADIIGFASGNESDGSDLKRGTVALATLTRAEPQPQA